MEPDSEVEAFIARIVALPDGPGIDLNTALQPSLDYEEGLRKLFANDRSNEKISNRYAGLVDLFSAPEAIKKTKARVVKDGKDLSSQYALPLTEKQRRKEGTPCMVSDLDEFRKNWSIFTEGSLSQLLDWNNVIAAGGSVLACLAPLDKQHTVSKRTMRKHYHSNAYPSSDIDLFLYGLDAKQAEAKMQYIYEAVRDSIPWDTTCIRTKHTISIHSQYPYRAIQIVLRLYQTPAEVLAGFDVDAPCCAYDGQKVWANPRAIVAMMRQCNTVDMSRRSPSYEVRLAKYASRGYEVFVSNLKREEIDPTIYERSIAKMTGLARLLVLEKLTTTDTRYEFLESRRRLRARPLPTRHSAGKQALKGDLKADDTIAGLELNNYDVTVLHIPYGPNWNARRIDKLVYQTDLAMNSTFNPKNKKRRLHRHPAFFGTMEECLEDCCEMCPEPIDGDERKLQETEDEQYIRGRNKFIEDDPGRQTVSGSFRPIDDGEWAEQVYLKPTQKLFAAIAKQDRAEVQKLIGAEDIDLQQRDHVGRSCLHLAIITKSSDIACDLIEAGARITARLVDGRTSLHLTAQYGDGAVMNKLFERNAVNIAEDEKNNPKPKEDSEAKTDDPKSPQDEEKVRPSSADDWSSHSDDDVEMVDGDKAGGSDEVNDGEEDDSDNDNDNDEDEEDEASKESDGDGDSDGENHEAPARSPSPPPADILDDEDEPDIIDINQFDFDFGLSALGFAVLFAPVAIIDRLIKEGADVKLHSKESDRGGTPLHPLTMTALREDEDEACLVAESLIKGGATCTTASDDMVSIFHSFVSVNKAKLLAAILQCEENAASMLNFPRQQWSEYIFPAVTAIQKQYYASLAVLLSHDVKLAFEEKDIIDAQEAMPPSKRFYNDDGCFKDAHQPIETAFRSARELVPLLTTFGAPINVGLRRALAKYSDADQRRTTFEWAQFALKIIKAKIQKLKVKPDSMDTQADASDSPWKKYLQVFKKSQLKEADDREKTRNQEERERKLDDLKETQEYFEGIIELLQAHKAQGWKTVYPDVESTATTEIKPDAYDSDSESKAGSKREWTYSSLSSGYGRQAIPNHLVEPYDDLFEACFAGHDDKVKQLCMPEANPAMRPLKVSVRVDQTSNAYDKIGFTPLSAAILGGKWTTAKLLLSISTAQYRPEDPKERPFKVSKIKLDDSDSDGGDDGEDSDTDSDMTVDGKAKFIDIATHSSTIHSSIKPSEVLEHQFYYEDKPVREWTTKRNVLTKAVVDGDTDTFLRIANLYQAISHPLERSESDEVLTCIIEYDRPEMLDLYIKRTGYGIDFEHAQKHSDTPPAPSAVNDKNRVYLGLNVHGRKRADLAKQNDPDANKSDPSTHIPLVWRAASQKSSHKTLQYLASDKPIEAFRHYASTHTDERAIWLKRLGGVSGTGLGKHLPVWLGWTTTRIGESPLTAAIVGKQNSLHTIKLLMEIQPQVMTPTFSTKIVLVNYNMLLLAVQRGSSRKVVDFLLGKSNSPTHTSHHGWNVYHILAKEGNFRVFEHLLKILPKEVSQTLLLQQNTPNQQTPLHIAVENNHPSIVKPLVEFSKASLLVRDVNGSTSLHTAVRVEKVKLFKLLSTYVSDPSAFFMEDSVGHTVLDVITWPELTERLGSLSSTSGYMNELDPDDVPLKGPWSSRGANTLNQWRRWRKDEANRLLPEIRYAKGVMDSVIIPEERRKRRTKVVWEVNKFIDQLNARMKKAVETYEKELAERQQKRKARKVPGEETDDEDADSGEHESEGEDESGPENDEKDRSDMKLRSLLTAVRETLANHPDQKRQLIHVADVQQSVSSALTSAMKATQPKGANENDAEGLAEEAAQKEKHDELKELKDSLLWPYVNFGGDEDVSDDDSDLSS